MRVPTKRTSVMAAVIALIAAAFVLPWQPSAQASSPGWITICSYTRSLADDPIVHPRETGASHLHDFMGNRSVDAASTYASMTAAGTSCGTSADTAGYWAPALYRNGVKINPVGFRLDGKATRNTFYYRGDNLKSSYHITAFPADFRLVAGQGHATSEAENPYLGREIYWGCSDNSTGKLKAPPNCASGAVSLHIGFPNCWDGVTTHTNDTAHVVYPSSYACPAGFPIALPRVIMRLEYPVGPSSAGITLSSGPYYTIHADFWNTWDQAALQKLVDSCLNQHLDCGNDPKPSATTTATASATATATTTAAATPKATPSATPSATRSTTPTPTPTSTPQGSPRPHHRASGSSHGVTKSDHRPHRRQASPHGT